MYVPINKSTQVCSEHFVNAVGRQLHPDEYMSLKLLVLSTTIFTEKASQRVSP